MDNFTFITVPFETAEAVVHAFRDKGRKPLVTMAKNPKVFSNKSKRTRDTRKRWRGRDEYRGGREEKRGGREEKRERPARRRKRRSE